MEERDGGLWETRLKSDGHKYKAKLQGKDRLVGLEFGFPSRKVS